MQVMRILITCLFLKRIIPRRVIKLALYRTKYAVVKALNKFMHLAAAELRY